MIFYWVGVGGWVIFLGGCGGCLSVRHFSGRVWVDAIFLWVGVGRCDIFWVGVGGYDIIWVGVAGCDIFLGGCW